jgi:stage V sporulation protein R
VGYHRALSTKAAAVHDGRSRRLDFYFDVFLQSILKVRIEAYVKEIERFNADISENSVRGEDVFFVDVKQKHPEFEALFQKHLQDKPKGRQDLIQFLLEHSEFLNKEENRWMKTVIEVVRNTSLFFQPQIRTKIMNEGWASYWHEQLFLKDERIQGHEVEFARVNAMVTSLPRVGVNPYALGMRLFAEIEEMAEKGRYDYAFQRLLNAEARKKYDAGTGQGRAFIFAVRENYCDSMFINSFLTQEFMDTHNLFVAGKRLNKQKMVWEYYIKSRDARAYRQMIQDSLYHPPHITVKEGNHAKQELYLVHHFEGKPLVAEFIANTMMGIEYLWGKPVMLETSEVAAQTPENPTVATARPVAAPQTDAKAGGIVWRRVVYTMKERKLSKREI